MFDTPAAAPLDIRDLLADLLLDPALAYAALARLSGPQRAMQALCVAAVLEMDDAALLAVWDARIGAAR
jgi:hypothetical protein